MIASVPEVRDVMSQVGRPDDGTDVTSFFNLEFNVPLRPMEEWREGMTRQKIEDELMEKFEDYPGLSFSFSQLIRDNIDEALSGIKGANSIKLFGGDLDTLEETGQRIVNVLRSVRGIENVGLFHIVGQPNLEIRIDRRAVPDTDSTSMTSRSMIEVAIGGRGVLGDGRGGRSSTRSCSGCRKTCATTPRTSPGSRSTFPNPRAARGGIPLSQLAEIVPHKSGASYIYRENNRRFIPIKFSVRGRPLLGDRRSTPQGGGSANRREAARGLSDAVVG